MSPAPIVVSAFYKFVKLDDIVGLRDVLAERCDRLGICGSILLAPEGINGTVAGSRASTDALFGSLREDPRFRSLKTKESLADGMPFLRMKVRLKREIVTFRQPVDPTERVGTYVAPRDWNEVISDPEVLVIDTRNRDEVALGTMFVFDNGRERNFSEEGPEYSRGVEYAIDEEAMTVEQVWQYGKERGEAFYSPIISDVDYLPQTGNRLIMPGIIGTFSPPSYALMTEVTYPDKEVVFEARLEFKNLLEGDSIFGDSIYRAERLPLYPGAQ